MRAPSFHNKPVRTVTVLARIPPVMSDKPDRFAIGFAVEVGREPTYRFTTTYVFASITTAICLPS